MSTYANAIEVAQAWIKAVNSGEVSTILSLYSPEALLLPTFSPHTLRTQEERRGYFEVLSSRPGFAVSIHEKTLKLQVLSKNMEIVSGIYRFHLDIDGEPLVFEARFSLVVDLGRPGPIVNHHSSQIPRTLN